MRSKDTLRRDTLRFLLSAVQREKVDRLQATIDRLISEGKDESQRQAYMAEHPNELDDAVVTEVIQRQAKMRRDSIEAFRKGGRQELVDKEERELAILSEYLPKQMSDDEIRAVVASAIAEAGASGPRDIGKVMPIVLPKVRADGKRVAAIVQQALKEKGA